MQFLLQYIISDFINEFNIGSTLASILEEKDSPRL